ncbi:MAG: Gfo/Idh/MocA family oxidoreductase [Bacteroidales bacterium]|nr:Gfo/Idh/MocA family oxidoreductase [Bacteroidales bacterium]
MKIGIIGLNSLTDETQFINIKSILDKNLHGLFSPNIDNLLPISEKYKVKLFSSSETFFSSIEAVYCAQSNNSNFEFLIKAIKSSCHLFIEDISIFPIDEIKQLYKLAFEASVKIHIKQTKLFNSELQKLSNYINKCKLVEINTSFTSLLRKQDYFTKLFNNFCLADKLNNSSAKKINIQSLPIDCNHFSLIQVRLDYDNGSNAIIKLNNLASVCKDTILAYQKNSNIEIDFKKHLCIKHYFENGQIIRKEIEITKTESEKTEFKYFMELCSDSLDKNILELPVILNTIQNTFHVINQLNQIAVNI